MNLIVTALLATIAMSAAQAQTVYRCGSTYSQAACPQATLIDVSDDRSPAQQSESRRVADDERRMATEMRRERIADERAAHPGGAASLSGQTSVKVVVVTPEHPHKKKNAFGKTRPTTDFVAFDPSSRKRRSGT